MTLLIKEMLSNQSRDGAVPCAGDAGELSDEEIIRFFSMARASQVRASFSCSFSDKMSVSASEMESG